MGAAPSLDPQRKLFAATRYSVGTGIFSEFPSSFLAHCSQQSFDLYEPSNPSKLLHTVPYHHIASWGYRDLYFQLRGLNNDDVVFFSTENSIALNDELMKNILSLVSSIQVAGLEEDVFEEFSAQLEKVSNDSDQVLHLIRTFESSRSFTGVQMAKIMALVGKVNPFLQIDAAVELYSRLLDPVTSFHIVLSSIPDAGDRDNLCHRLGLTLQPNSLSYEARNPKGR